MSLTDAINVLSSTRITTLPQAEAFVSTLEERTREQLLAAIYIGREHIHVYKLRDDVEISREYTAHISTKDLPRIIWEKGADNMSLYLGKFQDCAEASGFDINEF